MGEMCGGSDGGKKEGKEKKKKKGVYVAERSKRKMWLRKGMGKGGKREREREEGMEGDAIPAD